MADIPSMKSHSLFLALALMAASASLRGNARADGPDQVAQYRETRAHNTNRPARSTNQVANPSPPADKLVKFKDLPVNAEFYYPADKDHKLFPRKKISDVAARTVPTPASPNVTINPVPAETLVIEKKKDHKTEADKKAQDGKKDGSKS